MSLSVNRVLEAGSYRLIVKASRMRDPFQRNVDGDGDGIAGGDFVYNFEASEPVITIPAEPVPSLPTSSTTAG